MSDVVKILMEMTDRAIEDGTLSRTDAARCRQWLLAHEIGVLTSEPVAVRLSGDNDK